MVRSNPDSKVGSCQGIKLANINDGSNITMNDSNFNNQYSQNQKQYLFNSIINSVSINLLLLGQSNHQFHYLNHYNLLNSTELNININTNNNRNTNYEGNNYKENPFNQNSFNYL